MAHEISRWRVVLRTYVVRNPEGKENVAHELGVSVRTIDRWIAKSSTTDPERRHIAKLARAIPGHEEEMELSLKRDYPDAFEQVVGDKIMIPSPFYDRPLESLAMSASNLSRPDIRQTVMKQMVRHLDPNEVGLMVLFVQCVKPVEPDGRVNSLLVHSSGHGTNESLWQYRQVERPYMLGAGSLSAMAIVRGDMAFYPQDMDKIDNTTIILHGDKMQSCVALPIFREGDIAGALFIASVQPEFFVEVRRELIKKYSYLFAVGLRDHEFYPQSQIDLQPMPSLSHQSKIYRGSQQFLEDLAKQFPHDTPDQLENRARQIFDECLIIIKERESANAE